jgi:hypothetical protein
MPDIYNVLQDLKYLPRLLDSQAKMIIDIPQEENFQQIKKLIDKLAKPSTPRPPPRSEYYLQKWQLYRQNKIANLESTALKYLCWECDLLDDPVFCDYLIQNIKDPNARIIKGLVGSIHLKWEKDSPNKEIVRFTSKQLSIFSGKDRTLSKWKTGTNMLLGTNGPALFANKALLESCAEPKVAADDWAISEHSKYMRYVVVNAAEQCLDRIGQNLAITDYVLNKLLFWNGWNIDADGFMFIVRELILHSNVHSIIEKLRSNILRHRLLGDPRLPANRNKWLGVDSRARQRFIGWLARRDIVFFFDHVLEGHDPHGRRDFWLKYVDRMVASRPLLSDSTAFQFRGNKDVNFGRLSAGTNKAAFVLHFGEIVAVEFSDVGKVYIYKLSEFERFIEDMWTASPIREDRLKNQHLPDERMIRHVNWQYKVVNILAREGIRQ